MRNTMPKTVALLAGSALLAAGTAHADRSEWPTNFTVGTASQGGTYFVYGSGWANFIAEELDVSGGGEVTGGPTQNLALVHSGDMAFGLTTMGPASDAIKGESPLAPGLVMDNVCALFPMYETPFSIAALSSSGIESISDIPDGARIGFGPAASTSDTYFPAMLETLGVNFDRRNGGWSDLGGQLQDGLLDVVAFAAGIPIPAVSQLEVQTDVNIIEFTEEELATVLDAFPVAEFTIPASTYTTLKRMLAPFPCGTSRLLAVTCRKTSSMKSRKPRWKTMIVCATYTAVLKPAFRKTSCTTRYCLSTQAQHAGTKRTVTISLTT